MKIKTYIKFYILGFTLFITSCGIVPIVQTDKAANNLYLDTKEVTIKGINFTLKPNKPIKMPYHSLTTNFWHNKSDLANNFTKALDEGAQRVTVTIEGVDYFGILLLSNLYPFATGPIQGSYFIKINTQRDLMPLKNGGVSVIYEKYSKGCSTVKFFDKIKGKKSECVNEPKTYILWISKTPL